MSEKLPSFNLSKGGVIGSKKKLNLNLPTPEADNKKVSVTPVIYRGDNKINLGVDANVKTKSGIELGVSKFGKQKTVSLRVPIKSKKK